MLVGGWFATRIWAKRQLEMYDIVDRFDIRSARCFCETDRSYVLTNVANFMIAHDLVSSESTKEDALNAFNAHVKTHVPGCLCASLPRAGVSYKIAVAIFAFDLCDTFIQISLLIQQGISIPELLGQGVVLLCFTFFVCPNLLTTLSVCASRSLQHGIFGSVAWFALALVIGFGNISAQWPLETLAMQGSAVGIIGLILYELANAAAVVYFYRPRHKRFAEKQGSSPACGEPAASADAPHALAAWEQQQRSEKVVVEDDLVHHKLDAMDLTVEANDRIPPETDAWHLVMDGYASFENSVSI